MNHVVVKINTKQFPHRKKFEVWPVWGYEPSANWKHNGILYSFEDARKLANQLNDIEGRATHKSHESLQ